MLEGEREVRLKKAALLIVIAGCAGEPAPGEPGEMTKPVTADVGWTDLASAKASGKPVFIFFCASGDEQCGAFESDVLADDEVTKALKEFACVRREAFGAGGMRDAEFERLGFAGVPAIAILVKGKQVEAREYAVDRLEFLKALERAME